MITFSVKKLLKVIGRSQRKGNGKKKKSVKKIMSWLHSVITQGG